ncbi:hypothetical protein BHYA_0225g00280 [Botrytis hyacinthi]|uniref:Uncharacterized protein n=1 Tax=Botrytis hyacinthi TaxID=278943 RepID=A0A4Z1GAK7_9HELO|nr:hypothetical protein BHYA_0225g00280 [Botrytis hyacinthi]
MNIINSDTKNLPEPPTLCIYHAWKWVRLKNSWVLNGFAACQATEPRIYPVLHVSLKEEMQIKSFLEVLSYHLMLIKL